MINGELTVDELMDLLNKTPKSYNCFKRIGFLNPELKQIYKQSYDRFIYCYENEKLNGKDKKDDNLIKGNALENLVSDMFKTTGEYFEIYRNIKNGVNEIDLFVEFSQKGKALCNLFDKRYSNIMCECKNYHKAIGVTYIGKFYSLMQSTNHNVGIMFSYDGLTGKSWGAATGLTKKLFLLKEQKEDKIYILSFSKSDFEDILHGKSLFNILDDKCKSLELGIDDINKYIVKHPNEDKI